MASLNTAARELVLKIVYYGPGLGGKTTTLQSLHESSPPERRGKLVSLATPVDRTLYFDFLPLRLPALRGLGVRLQLFTVPGQVYFNATRRLVLSGADGIVFVADSQAERLDANLESLENLRENLTEHGRELASLPHAFAFNKRDLGDLLTLDELDRALNRHGAPTFGTVATRGDGTLATLDEITRRVLVAYEAQLPTRGPTPSTAMTGPEAPSVEVRTPAPPATVGRPTPAAPAAAAPLEPTIRHAMVNASSAAAVSLSAFPDVVTSAHAEGVLREARRQDQPGLAALQEERESVVGTSWEAEAEAQALSSGSGDGSGVGAPSRAAPLSIAPRAGLSFASLFSPVERAIVHEIEDALEHGAHAEALSACDTALIRMLAPIAALLGAGPLDPSLPLLVGIDGRRFLSFRALVRRARQHAGVGPRDALEGYAFLLESHAALTQWEALRASTGASAMPPPRRESGSGAPDSTPPLPPSSIAPPPL